jgi:hypothetical protein
LAATVLGCLLKSFAREGQANCHHPKRLRGGCDETNPADEVDRSVASTYTRPAGRGKASHRRNGFRICITTTDDNHNEEISSMQTRHRILFGLATAMLATTVMACSLQTSEAEAKNNDNPATTEKASPPDRITSKVDVQQGKLLNHSESKTVSLAAGRILQHVSEARSALKAKKPEEASEDIDKGLTLVRIIDSVLPQHKVHTQIKSGDIVYEDDDQVTPNLIAIYDELAEVDIVGPVVSAKKEQEAKQEAKQEQAKAGQAEQEKAGPPSARPIVEADAMTHTAVKLNLPLAKRMLTMAKQQIQDKKPDDADAALLAIQAHGVIFEFVEVDLPLETAADNLKLAEQELDQGRHEEAKAALAAATDALKEYEALAGESRSKEVRELHQEIDKVAQTLTKDTEKEGMKKEISTWWDRVRAWFKK